MDGSPSPRDLQCPYCTSNAVLLLTQRNAYLCGECESVWKPEVASSSATEGYLTIAAAPHRMMVCNKPPSLRIFLSYGHDIFETVGFHLKELLEDRGHRVWVDVENMPAGAIDWEMAITTGLESVERERENGRVLLLMTPHALRRPDGYCLNEVAAALDRRLKIFPVMLVDVAPPRSIAAMDYFDMCDLMPRNLVEAYANGVSPDDLPQVSWTDVFSGSRFRERAAYLVSMLELGYFSHSLAGGHLRSMNDRGSHEPEQRRHRSETKEESTPAPPAEDPRAVAADTRVYISCEPWVNPLAERIAADLREAGYQVWYDGQRNCSTDVGDRATYATEGVSWTAESTRRGKMIVLLTPGAVREGGYNNDEIMSAMYRGLQYIPISVRRCAPPLTMCRIQYLNMRDVITDEGELVVEKYDVKKELLFKSLLSSLDVEGNQSRLANQLSPISYEAELSVASKFYGRSWLLTDLDGWLKASGPRMLWWTSRPSLGKTAIAAHVCATKRSFPVYCFASFADDTKRDARRAILTLAYQLTSFLPEYEKALAALPLENMSISSLFRELLVTLLKEIPAPEEPFVMVLDGIDAMTTGSRNELAEVLIHHLHHLPAWLRVLVLSRDDPVLRRIISSEALHRSLDDDSELVNKDLQTYLYRELRSFSNQSTMPSIATSSAASTATDATGHSVSSSTLGSTLDAVPEDVAVATGKVMGRADGLLLYAEQVVLALQEGRLTLDSVEQFPSGLAGVFQRAMQQQVPDAEEYRALARPVLEVIAAAKEPLQRDVIREVLRLKVDDEEQVMHKLAPLLLKAEGKLQPFHSGFITWLSDPDAAGKYVIDVHSGHAYLGRWAFEVIDFHMRSNPKDWMQNTPSYILRHALTHLSSVPSEIKAYQTLANHEQFQLATSVQTIKDHGLESFYHGAIDRRLAVERLTGRPPLSFLVRYSVNERKYCVSFLSTTGVPQHNVVFEVDGGISIVPPDVVVQSVTQIYPDLSALVVDLMITGHARYPVPPPGHTTALTNGAVSLPMVMTPRPAAAQGSQAFATPSYSAPGGAGGGGGGHLPAANGAPHPNNARNRQGSEGTPEAATIPSSASRSAFSTLSARSGTSGYPEGVLGSAGGRFQALAAASLSASTSAAPIQATSVDVPYVYPVSHAPASGAATQGRILHVVPSSQPTVMMPASAPSRGASTQAQYETLTQAQIQAQRVADVAAQREVMAVQQVHAYQQELHAAPTPETAAQILHAQAHAVESAKVNAQFAAEARERVEELAHARSEAHSKLVAEYNAVQQATLAMSAAAMAGSGPAVMAAAAMGSSQPQVSSAQLLFRPGPTAVVPGSAPGSVAIAPQAMAQLRAAPPVGPAGSLPSASTPAAPAALAVNPGQLMGVSNGAVPLGNVSMPVMISGPPGQGVPGTGTAVATCTMVATVVTTPVVSVPVMMTAATSVPPAGGPMFVLPQGNVMMMKSQPSPAGAVSYTSMAPHSAMAMDPSSVHMGTRMAVQPVSQPPPANAAAAMPTAGPVPFSGSVPVAPIPVVARSGLPPVVPVSGRPEAAPPVVSAPQAPSFGQPSPGAPTP